MDNLDVALQSPGAHTWRPTSGASSIYSLLKGNPMSNKKLALPPGFVPVGGSAQSLRGVGIIAGAVVIGILAISVLWIAIMGSPPHSTQSQSVPELSDCERINQKMQCEICTLTEEERRVGLRCYMEKNRQRYGVTLQPAYQRR